MNKKPTIIMPIEISQRELLPKVHLALEAVKRNYRVYLCDFFAARALFKSTKKTVIFFHKSTWEAQAESVREHRHKFVFLDEEMGPAIPLERLKATLYNRWGRYVNSKKYDALFAIGPTHKDLGSQVISDENVPVYDTGWPRFDLWRPDIAPHISHTESPHPRKYHLFASSFGATKRTDFAARLLQAAQRAPQSLQMRRDREQSFYTCLPVLQQLAGRLAEEDSDLVIRPHNSESQYEWEDLFKGYTNVHIRRGGDLYSWLHNAESVLHAASTVAIQCALIGKTPIALCPMGTMKETVQCDLSLEAYDLDSVLEGQKISGQAVDISDIYPLITGLKGRTAAQNILDCMDDLCVGSQSPLKMLWSQRIKLLGYNGIFVGVRHVPFFYNSPLLSKLQSLKKYREKLDGGIKKNQIVDAIGCLSKVHGIGPREISLRCPAPQAFSIERRVY